MNDEPRRLILRPEFIEDLQSQAEYLDKQISADYSNRYLSSVDAALEKIKAMRSHLNPRLAGLRMFAVPNFSKYLIFYLTHDDSIEVIRILHSSQNIESIIASER